MPSCWADQGPIDLDLTISLPASTFLLISALLDQKSGLVVI
jgi:hypothetical protein